MPAKATNADLAECKSIMDFWAFLISNEMDSSRDNDEEFQQFCNAVLLSSLACTRQGVKRRYLEDDEVLKKGPSPAVNKYRRRLLAAAEQILLKTDINVKMTNIKKNNAMNLFQCINFSLDELWDGRMIFSIYRKIAMKEPVIFQFFFIIPRL